MQRQKSAFLLRKESLYGFMDLATEIFILLDSKLNFIYINESGTDAFNLSKDKVMQKNILDIFPDLKKRGTFDRYMEVLKTGKPFFYEAALFDSNFEEKYFNVKVFKVDGGLGLIFTDFTEPKKVDESLNQKDQYFRALIENSSHGIIVLDGDGIVRYLSPSFQRMMGRKPEDLIGASAFDPALIHPDDLPKVVEHFNLLCQDIDDAKNIEVRIKHNDDSWRWIKARADNHLDDPAVGGIVANFYDITDRKQIEKALHEGEMHLKATLNALPDLLFEVDKEGRIYDYHSSSSNLLYAPKEEFIGKTVKQVLPEESAEIIMDAICQASKTGKHAGATYSLELSTGKHLFELSISSKDLPNASDSRLIVLARDITDRGHTEEKLKESEQRFRTIFENAMDGILLADQESKKFWSGNEKICQMLGYTPEELKTLELKDVHPVEDFPFVLDQFEKQSKKEITLARDIPVKRKDGSVFYADINSSPMRLGDKSYLMGIFRDVTNRKLAEEQLKTSLKEKELLLREIHHRVKNNLQVVSGLIDIGGMRIQDQKVASLLDDIRSKIYSMSLIHTQLYRSKNLGRIEMKDHFQDLVGYMSALYGERKRVTTVVEVNDVYLPITQAIPCTLVITELISNSFKHAFNEGQKGLIKISMKKLTKDTIFASVKDDGIGITDEVDIYETDSMGLKLVRNLVQKQLNGRMWVERDLGTEFNIEFKILEEEVEK